eukprot:Colp12_sorted_trinity150504_noHs@15594
MAEEATVASSSSPSSSMNAKKQKIRTMLKNDPELAEEYIRSLDIDSEIKREKQARKNNVTLLLLGSGESGKSTFFKQLRILHNNGYSKAELEAMRSQVIDNVRNSILCLIQACEDLDIPLSAQLMQATEALIATSRPNFVESFKELVPKIKMAWSSEPIQKAFARRNEFALQESAAYFLEDVDRFADAAFVPTYADVLRMRAPTIGVVEANFVLRGLNFKIVDVGGQKSQRRKWLHVFEGVTAVLFVAALSCYDSCLAEDPEKNRMEDSLELFEEVVNNKFLCTVPFILFLNKKDVFAEKLATSGIASFVKVFPHYRDGPDVADARRHVKNCFMARIDPAKRPNEMLYSHYTCGTDTTHMETVFADVISSVIEKNLRNLGLA